MPSFGAAVVLFTSTTCCFISNKPVTFLDPHYHTCGRKLKLILFFFSEIAGVTWILLLGVIPKAISEARPNK
jgi:hypothetical protein